MNKYLVLWIVCMATLIVTELHLLNRFDMGIGDACVLTAFGVSCLGFMGFGSILLKKCKEVKHG